MASYSSADVKRAFSKQMAVNVEAAQSVGTIDVSPIRTMAPNINMTLNEIYLDFRTDPVGSLGVRDALVETGLYAGADLTATWTVGNLIGQGLNYVIETYDPGLGDAIGGTEYGMVQDIEQAASEFQQGQYEHSIDALFGSPLGDIDDYAGDDDVGGSYAFYESEPGSGC